MAQVLRTAYGREHPGAGEKRRLMTNMLTMSASQVGNPVAVLIQMIADDRLIHSHLTKMTRDFRIRNTTFPCNSATLC